MPKCFETALDSDPKLLSQGTPNKWQPWWNLTVPIPSTNVTFPGLWASLPRRFASIWSTWGCWTKSLAIWWVVCGLNIPLTLCLWLLRAYRMSQEAHVWERIGCGCLRRSYTCRICDVQRFKLSYPITFAIIQPLDVWGGSTSSRKTCIRLRDTSDTSDTEAIHGATSQSQPSTSRIVELHRFLS